MKTEWTFPWRTYDFHFKKVHRFVATFGATESGAAGAVEGMTAQVRVEPDAAAPVDHGVEQTGKLVITLPLQPEIAEGVAYAAAHNVGEQIAFRNGDFRVFYGFVVCKRIAENEEETRAIDGKPCTVTFHLEEVVETPAFDGSLLAETCGRGAMIDVLSQFNETRRDSSPVRKFLGFFRVLESLSHSEDGQKKLKQTLADYSLLRANYHKLMPEGDFKSFIETLVATRHRCAHLKAESGFGYTPNDPAVHRDVIPQLQLLEELTYRCIEGYVP